MPTTIFPPGSPIASLPPYAQKFFAALMAFYTHAKFTVVTGVLIAGVSFTVSYTVTGAGPFKAGKEIFVLPGPSVGAGVSFLVAAIGFWAYKLLQARRSALV